MPETAPTTTDPVTHARLVAGLDPDDGYAVVELRAPAGASLPPHTCAHESGTLLVLSGRLEVVLGTRRHLLGPGDLLALPRQSPRRMLVVADVRLLCVSVPAGLERLVDLIGPAAPGPDDRAALLAAAGVALLPPGWGAASG